MLDLRTLSLKRFVSRSMFISLLSFLLGTVVVGYVFPASAFSVWSVPVSPFPAVFFISGLLAGGAGMAGVLLGYGILNIVFNYPITPIFIGYFYFGACGYLSRGLPSRMRGMPVDEKMRNLAVLFIAPLIGAASITGFVGNLISEFHFYPYTPIILLKLFLSVICYVFPVLMLGIGTEKVSGRFRLTLPVSDVLGNPRGDSMGLLRSLTGIQLVWLVVGSGVSAAIHVSELVPGSYIRSEIAEEAWLARKLVLERVGALGTELFINAFFVTVLILVVAKHITR